MITGFFGLSTTGTIFLLLLVLLVGYLIFRVMQYLLKAVVVGIMFMAIPFVLQALGKPVATDIKSLLWYMILGIVMFFVMRSVRFGFKATQKAMSPFSKKFEKKKSQKNQ
ncbi:MAG: hypothetical protein ABIH90_00085 [Candidatus Aenigmatarchaeota archaeon]